MTTIPLLDHVAVERLAADDVSRLVVALSGGVDSVALLHAVWSHGFDKLVLAIHVNHNLQPAARGFEATCRKICESLSVPLHLESVTVDGSGSLEARAREARYGAFENFLSEGDLLLLAHHRDDQAETVLFRLLRDGRLEGMPEERNVGAGRLYRPLLHRGRQDILAYARQHNLDWSEDPSNSSDEFDRNYLRHEVLPVIESRWPGVRQTLVRGAMSARQLEGSHRQLVKAAGGLENPYQVPLATLTGCHRDALVARLRSWLGGLSLPLPTAGMLEEIAGQILEGRRVNAVNAQLAFRSHMGSFHVRGLLPPPCSDPIKLEEGSNATIGGVLTNKLVEGQGLRSGVRYEVRSRRGGEHIQVRHRRELKTLLQENQVPAWLRDYLPLVMDGEELVAIAGMPAWGLPMVVADGHEAGPHQGWLMTFEPGDNLKIHTFQ